MTTPITTTADRLMDLAVVYGDARVVAVLTGNVVEETAEEGAARTALCSAIKEMAAERDALRQQLQRMERRGDTFSEIIHNHCLAMSAALIEQAIGQGAEAGMRWIENTLDGPGLLPDLDEARRLGGAQAWFDAKTDEEEQRRAELRAKVVAGGENGNG